MRVLGLDIGGANVKAVVALRTGKGARIVWRKTVPLELFRNKEGLAKALCSIRDAAAPDAVAITMTGELCDCFSNRAGGVKWILGRAEEAFGGLPMKAMNNKGELVSIRQASRQPGAVASANWAATVRWAAENGLRDGIVVDIGSTTTDVLPVRHGKPATRGDDDFTRAREGELIYTGVLRTHAAMAAPRIAVQGIEMDSCPEYFAIVGDAHLLLGDISAGEYTCPTPDGAPKARLAAARRLCRMALSDLERLGMTEARRIATRIASAQAQRLAEGVARIAKREGLGQKARLLLIGSGAGVYGKAIGKRVGMKVVTRLGGIPSPKISPAACAAMLWGRGEVD